MPYEKRFSIPETGQVAEGELTIAVGNFWQGEYFDPRGAKQHGPTAGLWFYVRGRSELDRHERVFAGRVLDIAGYRVEVYDIDIDPVSYSQVEISVLPPE